MNRIWIPLAVLVVLAGMAALAWQSRADDQSKSAEKLQDSKPESGREDLPVKDYMRKKLEASNQILEGLCTEDSELILQGARTLNEMSQSERWRVNNDPMYRQFSGDFREITQQLIEAAEEKNQDRALLKWMDATMSCIDCHSFVRGIRIADRDAN
jgi:hypothetical protein